LKEVLTPYRSENGLPLAMRYRPGEVECEIRLPDEWRVDPADALQQSLKDVLGAKEVEVEY
jgi:DNA polymerase-3 subunit alpha